MSAKLCALSATAALLLLAGCQAASSPPILTLDASAPDPAFTRAPGALGSTRIYQHTFDAPPGPEWSFNKIARTQVGDRPYLGNVPSRKPVTLTLKDLPQHDLVRVTFDLYLFEGWNGSSPYWGFARWDMNLGDGRNLIHTSFSNCGGGPRLRAASTSNEQAFPDSFDVRIHPAFTGAAETSSLGGHYSGVYRFVLTFPHADKDITFGFQSVIQEGTNRTWGLANFTVETLPALPPHTEKEMEQLWKDLGSMDPAKAYAALWELSATGDQAVDYIAKHIEENIDMTAEEVAAAIKDLETADKERAAVLVAQLGHQGTTSLRAIREAYNREDITQEAKQYFGAALYIAKRYNSSATQARLARASQLLKIIHTKPALALALTIPEPQPRNIDAPNPTPVFDDKPRRAAPDVESQ